MVATRPLSRPNVFVLVFIITISAAVYLYFNSKSFGNIFGAETHCYDDFLVIQGNYNPSQRADKPSRKKPRPLIIAHRGGSGILPENTIEAYKLAIEQGADYIECDISVTKDLKLICLHDTFMRNMTNVGDIFPASRMSTYTVSEIIGTITDYFSVDFTLKEIKLLRVKQRMRVRDQSYNYMYSIPTLSEYIKVAKSASRRIGIIPENKRPKFVNSLKIMKDAKTNFERMVVEELRQHGYESKNDNCILQTFSYHSLKRFKKLTEMRLVWVFEMDDERKARAHLEDMAKIAYGIGPPRESILRIDVETKRLIGRTDLITRAHHYNLKVFPWTFKNHNLPFDYGHDPYVEYELFMELGADGFFTDFPNTLSKYFQKFKNISTNSFQESTDILNRLDETPFIL